MVENNAYIRHALGIAVRITILGLLFAGSAGAATITVCKSGCAYSSIQDAINASNTADTILVYSGTYFENVNVTKQLTLRGIGNPVVDAGYSGDAITLSANGIKLEGFTANAGISGIYSSYFSHNTLSNNTVRGGDYGFNLISSSNNTLSHNTVHSSVAFVAIRLNNCSNNTLIANVVRSDNGIFLIYSINNILIGNTAGGGMGAGIALRSSSNNTLNSNTATASLSGIYLYSSSNNTLNGNNISKNHDGGIYLYSSSNNKIYNNLFNNTNNFYFYDSNINTWNTTKISGINIIGGPYLGGNFWANPGGTGFSQTCSDVDTDGICDSIYLLESNNIDFLPLAKFTAAEIKVVSPNRGEAWPRGTKQTIRWTYSGTPGSNVRIELLKGGVLNRIINSSVPVGSSGSGSYNWLINPTQTPGTDYKVRITSTTNAAYTDTSNNNFNINAP